MTFNLPRRKRLTLIVLRCWKPKNRQLINEKQAVQQKAKDIAAREEQLQQREQSRKVDLLANGQAEVLVEQLRGTVSEKDKRILEPEQELKQKMPLSSSSKSRPAP